MHDKSFLISIYFNNINVGDETQKKKKNNINSPTFSAPESMINHVSSNLYAKTLVTAVNCTPGVGIVKHS